LKGYIKDYRKELQSDIWLMPPLYHRVWQYLKYQVNHQKGRVPMTDGTFKTVLPGQHLTSIRNIANGVSWYERGVEKTPNPRTISKILDWLEKQSMISIERGKGNRQYTLITLLNWDLYQSSEDESNSKETVSTSARQQSVHINKNDKECIKNDKEVFSSSTRDEKFAEVMEFYQMNLQRGISETPHNLELLNQFYDEFGNEVLLAAMKVSAENEAKGVKFLEGVLNNWREAGVKTIEDARRYEIEFRESKKGKFKRNVQRKTNEVVPEWFERREHEKEYKANNEHNENVVEIKKLLEKYQSEKESEEQV